MSNLTTLSSDQSVVICADGELQEILAPLVARYPLKAIVGCEYGELAETLFDQCADIPTASLIVCDLRASAGFGIAVRRAHLLEWLVRDYTSLGAAVPNCIVVMDGFQCDRVWLTQNPIFERFVAETDTFRLMMLRPWNDGSWNDQMRDAFEHILGQPGHSMQPASPLSIN